MNYTFFLILFWLLPFFPLDLSQSMFSLVFVHIGPSFPKYLPIAIAQARLFNPDCQIIVIGNSKAFLEFDNSHLKVVQIPIETIKLTQAHKKYQELEKRNGYWRFTLERFLYIDDLIQSKNLKNVFHIENDVMLYFSLEEKIEIFKQNYSGMMAAVFDCDERCVPDFVYFSDGSVSTLLADFICENSEKIDMVVLSLFKDKYYKKNGHLPILIPSYADDRPLISLSKQFAHDSSRFSHNLDKLELIFDAAALGQFLGGLDPSIGNSKPGFLGEVSVFIPIFFSFSWLKDVQGRFVPYISYKGDCYPIANLHIHSKNLQAFFSLNQELLPIPKDFWSSIPFNLTKTGEFEYILN